MPFGVDAPLLSYVHDRGIIESRDSRYALPDWVQDAMDTADYHEDFCRLIANAGAMCVEHYGLVVEGIETWRLYTDKPGWLILHFDGDKVDMAFYIGAVIHYAAFQAEWLSPMVQKIMAAEHHFAWLHEQQENTCEHSNVH